MQSKSKINRRKYIRTSTVLPVEFFIIDQKGKKITPWLQGFTQDIGTGGICLSINDLWWGFTDRLQQKGITLSLKINLPLGQKPIPLKAKVAWIVKKKLAHFEHCRVGLEFIGDNQKASASLFKFALFKKVIPYTLSILMSAVLVVSLSLYWRMASLARENRKLVSKYIRIIEKSGSFKESLEEELVSSKFLKSRQLALEERIESLNQEVVEWQDKYQGLKKKDGKESHLKESSRVESKVSSLESELANLINENQFLKNKEKESIESALRIQNEVKDLQKQKLEFSKKIIDGMYDWIKNRQDNVRGLVLSYEGDDSLDRVCFTYDQALASIVFLISGDVKRADKILDFYLKQIRKGQIYNAYFTQGDVFEYVIHSGPNAWVGLAALCYTKSTGDRKYLSIARKVGDVLLSMMDSEGGVIGGPSVSWYSTEHNLDAYAFFNLFYQITGERRYQEASRRVKEWIKRYSYTQYGPPVKRGKGDSTIATDTYTWSIAAFGPEKLYEMKMNPEEILKFAIEHCEVSINFKRNEGSVRLKGFDFGKVKNAPRGGVVSGEWTSQMILALEIMADYFEPKDTKKYNNYMKKSLLYFNELQKMLISSPSRAGKEDPCLPYASSPHIDTGHGWRTPKGDSTGSLASTAYFLIAYHGYNPLKGSFLQHSIEKYYQQEAEGLASFNN